MKRIIKIGFPIVCVAVIGGTFYLLNKTLDKVNASKQERENNSNVNEQNSPSYIDENAIIQNVLDKNSVNNVSNTNNISNTVTSTILVEEEEAIETKKIEDKEKAIELVKENEDERTRKVYYTNEGLDGDRYIVAVRYEDTTEVAIYYSVDVESESIEIYY
ncbi:MAG: hypothetical protein HFJ45_03325 [Clostridia bacterium]|nr:hypothetical protein [Clostridia bacterium]